MPVREDMDDGVGLEIFQDVNLTCRRQGFYFFPVDELINMTAGLYNGSGIGLADEKETSVGVELFEYSCNRQG